jgi:hypothetical protein
MDKLGDFASHTERFLRALARDLGVPAKKGEWLAANFANESVSFEDAVYLDSCCFIDAVKQSVGNLPDERDNDVWHIKKLLEAHRAGYIEVFTSILTLAECVAIEPAQESVPEDVQSQFGTY